MGVGEVKGQASTSKVSFADMQKWEHLIIKRFISSAAE